MEECRFANKKKICIGLRLFALDVYRSVILLTLVLDPWHATEAWWQLYDSTSSVLFFIWCVREVTKATVFFVMSPCLSACMTVLSVRMEQFGSHWTDFCEILFSGSFTKICPANWGLSKTGQNKGTLYVKTSAKKFNSRH
jgi:hypothetical protein